MRTPPHYLVLDATTGDRIAWVPARPGSAYDALAAAEVELPTRCRGHMSCGLCRVEVLEGAEALPPVLRDEDELLDLGERTASTRLACRIGLPPGVDRLVLGVRR